MTIGSNAPIGDKLIKKTVPQQETAQPKAESPAKATSAAPKTTYQRPLATRENATTNTVKMTFYVKQDLLDKLYNYSYWDRLSVTEAFNTALAEGLKNKNTDPIKKA